MSTLSKLLGGASVAALMSGVVLGVTVQDAYADPFQDGYVRINQSADACELTIEVTGGMTGVIEILSYPLGSDEVQVDSSEWSTLNPKLTASMPRGTTTDSQVEFARDNGTVFTQWVRSSCGVDVYITPGEHFVSGREWRTYCEPYSQTERCRTDIWATQVVYNDGKFVPVTNWHFNNLTYKAAPRSLYASNPLGGHGKVGGEVSWTAEDGREWRTECDTATTGRGGCRNYITAYVIETNVRGGHYWVKKEIFNSMVRFK